MNPLEKRIEQMSNEQLDRVFRELDGKYFDLTDDENLVWGFCFEAARLRNIIRIEDDEVAYNDKSEWRRIKVLN